MDSDPPITRHRGWSPIQVGSQIEVRCRFDKRWVGGFAVAEIQGPPGGRRFRVRRHSDGALLPACFFVDEIRPSDPASGPSRQTA